jgi:hypothetical protein
MKIKIDFGEPFIPEEDVLSVTVNDICAQYVESTFWGTGQNSYISNKNYKMRWHHSPFLLFRTTFSQILNLK